MIKKVKCDLIVENRKNCRVVYIQVEKIKFWEWVGMVRKRNLISALCLVGKKSKAIYIKMVLIHFVFMLFFLLEYYMQYI